jgi:hypothetical protein
MNFCCLENNVYFEMIKCLVFVECLQFVWGSKWGFLDWTTIFQRPSLRIKLSHGCNSKPLHNLL